MRVFAFATVLSLAATLASTSGSAVFAQAEAAGESQISDCDKPTEPTTDANTANAAANPNAAAPMTSPATTTAADTTGQDVIDDGCQEGRFGAFCQRFKFSHLNLNELALTRRHDWTCTADVLAVQRSSARSQTLANNASGVEVQNANDLDFPVAMGLQVSAICHDVRGVDVEIGYLQIDGWLADADVYGTSYPVYDNSHMAAALTGVHDRYQSALHVAEINLRHDWGCGFTTLAGFRSGELDEVLGDTGYASNRGTTYYVNEEVKTFNHLYGVQLGANWEFYNVGGPLRLSASCKAGLFDNCATQSTALNDGINQETLAATRDQVAFMGDAGIAATYQWNQHIGFRLSAQAVWINGVALAPEQISAINATTGDASIDTNGSVFYFGAGGGVELKF